jgi:hypothetical protein
LFHKQEYSTVLGKFDKELPAILGTRLSVAFRKRESLTLSHKATKRGLIKPVEVFNCAIIGACHLSQKHKPQKPIADSG